MSLIQSINGDLLLRLADTAGGSGSGAAGSTVNGQGASSSFDSDAANFTAGFELGASIFADSNRRLNIAFNKIRETVLTLDSLSAKLERMLDLAKRATSETLTPADRSRLNNEFQSLVSQFRTTVSDAQSESEDPFTETEDLLLKSDLKQILEDAGIATGSSSNLAQAFARAGGVDGRLAEKAIRSEDIVVMTNNGAEFAAAPSGSDPLNQDISTIGEATIAVQTLTKFAEDLQNDLTSMEKVAGELHAAVRFSLSGYSAFLQANGELSSGAGPEQLADFIVAMIGRTTRDTALAAHSDLDRDLARELLGE